MKHTSLLRTVIVYLTLGPIGLALNAAPASEKLFEWTPAIGNAIQTSTAAPCLASRNLAIIYTAAFEAANAQQPRYQPYLESLPKLEGEINEEVASLSALSFAAKILFPSQRAQFSTLREKQFSELKLGVSEDIWARSLQFGESVAKLMIDQRADDGSTSPLTYYPKDEIGKWKRTPPDYRPPELSYWSETRTFGLVSADQFRLPPPLPLNSSEYAAEYKMVKELGSKSSITRTADQTEIAKFWSCFSYTSTPAGHWYEIATRVAEKENLDYLDSVRLLALINLSMADAGIACWDTKYNYESWRPIQAIRLADQDGNPNTVQDETWDSLLVAPPHPEYISGHGAFSGAGGRIMELLFEKDCEYSFSTTSSSLPGVVRSYASFDACTDEICLSRVYGGIHFQYSNLRGKILGEQVADYFYSHFLQPINER